MYVSVSYWPYFNYGYCLYVFFVRVIIQGGVKLTWLYETEYTYCCLQLFMVSYVQSIFSSSRMHCSSLSGTLLQTVSHRSLSLSKSLNVSTMYQLLNYMWLLGVHWIFDHSPEKEVHWHRSGERGGILVALCRPTALVESVSYLFLLI